MWTLLSIVCLFGSAAAFAGRNVLKRDGATLIQCNQENPCPNGYGCMANPFVPGTYGCFSNVRPEAEKRTGTCPTQQSSQSGAGGAGRFCMFNQDCGANERCCPSTGGTAFPSFGGRGRFNGGGRRGKRSPPGGMRMMVCTPMVPAPSGQPKLTVLFDGVQESQSSQGLFPVKWIGTSTLVQSNGYNVLVDTGSATTGAKIISGLADNGLTPADIDFVVVTHWHPDHSGSVNILPNAEGAFGALKYNGAVYDAPPFPGKWYLNNDQNLEIIATPGHSDGNKDISLMVKNVQGLGTVLVAGDLFLFRDDYNAPNIQNADDILKNSRKAAGCQAQWIVPGHGPMYQVDAQIRQAIGC